MLNSDVPILSVSDNLAYSQLQPFPTARADFLGLRSHSANLTLHSHFGEYGQNTLLRTSGDNVLIGGTARDLFNGGNGDDYLYGSSGQDSLNGGSGDDQLIGGTGEDYLVGGRGDDQLFGQAGDDLLWGNRGQDSLNGGTGRDRLEGGRGRDILIDRDGGDILKGGRDIDQFWIGDGTLGATQIEDFRIGVDQLKFLELGVTLDQLSFHENAGITSIFYQEQQLAVLHGVRADELTPTDFLFGDASLVEDLQTALNRASEQESPGATLAVITPDGFVWTGAGGFSDVENQIPMQASDRLDVASTTKPMVATVVLQLMQEGQLSLDDSLSQWLPEVGSRIENSETITLRNLLNHSSGISDYLGEYTGEIKDDLTESGVSQAFLQYLDGRSADFQPGEGYSYSNTNFVLLGLVVEAVTNASLASQLRERIFEPLGMNNSFYAPQEAVPGGYLQGYTTSLAADGTPQTVRTPPIPPTALGFGDGGVVSTASDLSRFIQALTGGELLAPSTFQQMVQDRYPGSDPLADFNYGLGLQQIRREGIELLGHTGGADGSTTLMFYSPNQEFTAVSINNVTPRDNVGLQLGDEVVGAILNSPS